MKKLSGCILAIVLLVSLCVVRVNALTQHILSMYKYAQETDYWCWAACAQMEGKYYTGSLRPQSSIVTYIKGSPALMPGTVSETINASKYATYNQYNFTSTTAYQSYSVYQGLIDADKPVIMLMNNYSPGFSYGGHYIMAFGYLLVSNQNGIRIYDPYKNANYDYNYSAFLTGSHFGGTRYCSIYKN